MTVLLVLFTLIAFLIVDYFVQRKAQRKLAHVAIRSMELPLPGRWRLTDDLLLAPNHTWVRREQDGSVSVGLDSFLLGLTGPVERISVPREGEMVEPGSPAITLQEKNKVLKVDAPIEGQVLKVNTEALRNPPSLNKNPYTAGWLFTILPADPAASWSQFLRGEAALEWLKKQSEQVKEFLIGMRPRLEFATMQDGGVPVEGVLKGFNKDVWSEFEKQFIGMHTRSLEGEYDNA
jgi:glycine cleavage system H protein